MGRAGMVPLLWAVVVLAACAGATPQQGDPCGALACSVDARCQVHDGKAMCVCRPGYGGNGLACADIDECAVGTDDCGPAATCTNLPGSYRCTCDPGLVGDGHACAAPAPGHLAVASDHACAIHADGTLWCWGQNLVGQLGDGTRTDRATPVQVGDGADWVQVVTRRYLSYGVRAGGRLFFWGRDPMDDAYHETPEALLAGASWRQVSTGDYFACGIQADGSLWCWRGADPISGVVTPWRLGTRSDWRAVSMGHDFGCALATDGSVWCWGDGGNGELGGPAQSDTPVEVGRHRDWTALSAGDHGVCGIRNGELYCWGWVPGVRSAGATPTRVGTGTGYVRVTTGGHHTCALDRSGAAWCLGDGTLGALGTPLARGVEATPVHVAAADTWIALGAGDDTTCGIRADGRVACWGSNAWGLLGQGTTAGKTAPTPVGTNDDWSAVSVGFGSTCGIRAGGALYCWGDDAKGKLGLGSRVAVQRPVRVGQGLGWSAVALGWRATCGLQRDGSLWCWGDDDTGQLGLAAPPGDGVLSPVEVGSATWTAIAAGGGHFCGLRTDGTLWCWGDDLYGRPTDPAGRPVQVVGGAEPFVSVIAGGNQSCGLDAGGTLWCWGDDTYGQLGIGQHDDTVAVPTAVTPGPWATAAMGSLGGCALDLAGRLWCWGSDFMGQVGVPNPPIPSMDVLSPVQVGSAADWTAISTDWGATCGLRQGALWCWGDDAGGFLGLGVNNHAYEPVRVGEAADWTTVSVGHGAWCGIRQGRLYCWGAGTRGELGLGDAWSTTPVDVK